MTATKGFSRFKKCFAKRLESIGFVSEDKVFSRRMNDTKIVVEVQRDVKWGTREQIFFTVNVGISADAIRMGPFDDPQSNTL